MPPDGVIPGGPSFVGTPAAPVEPVGAPVSADGWLSVPGGPGFAGQPQPPDVPCDPTGEDWRGPPGPAGPPGEDGEDGTGGFPEAPTTGTVYGRQGSTASWLGVLPLTGGTVSGATTFNATLSGTAFGTGVNQVLKFTDSGSGQSLASITTAGKRLVFRRPTNALNDFADLQFQRTTSFSGGTLSDINRNLFILNSYGANDTCSNHGIIITATSASTGNGYNLPIWCQAIRTDGGKSWLSGGLFSSEDQNALGTLASGVPNLNSVESSTAANRADDAFNGNTWGNKGVRKNIHVVFSRANQADTTQAEVTSGIWFTTGTAENYGVTSADLYSNYQSVIAVGINTQLRNMLDVRGAITPTGSSNPVSAVTMNAGHVIDFNGGPALDSAPGRYLQYTVTGTARLRYMVGTNERFAVSDAGVATVGAGPANPLDVATKAYVDGAVVGGGGGIPDAPSDSVFYARRNATWIAAVGSFNTRTGAVTLTSGDVTTALTFTPYNATNPSGYQTAANVAAGAGTAYTMAGYVGGVLTASQVLLVHQVGQAVTFPANFGTTTSGASSRCGSLANATASTVLTVGQCPAASDPTVGGNYTTIGTLTFSVGGHAGALATSGGTTKAIAAGDFIRITGPASADATLANVFLTLIANR